MFDHDFIKKHAFEIWTGWQQIDWHLKQVAFHSKLPIGPIYGQRPLSNDQRTILLGFLSEIQPHKFPPLPELPPMNYSNFDSNKYHLIYLTGHCLAEMIRAGSTSVLGPGDDVDRDAIWDEKIAEKAVNLAQVSLDKINQINQKQKENARSGSTNGWRWSIHPWDFNALDNSVWPDTTWYADIHGKEQSLTADEFSCPQEALSTILQFCGFHPCGRINSSHPIKPFQINPSEY